MKRLFYPPCTYYHGRATGLSTRYRFLRHVNTNTLALVLFVAMALVGITRAKEPQNNESAHTGDAGAELAVRARDMSVSVQQGSAKNSWNKIAPNR
jgi:hypothetical protein